MTITHVNPNCTDATRCLPHGESGPVSYREDHLRDPDDPRFPWRGPYCSDEKCRGRNCGLPFSPALARKYGRVGTIRDGALDAGLAPEYGRRRCRHSPTTTWLRTATRRNSSGHAAVAASWLDTYLASTTRKCRGRLERQANSRTEPASAASIVSFVPPILMPKSVDNRTIRRTLQLLAALFTGRGRVSVGIPTLRVLLHCGMSRICE